MSRSWDNRDQRLCFFWNTPCWCNILVLIQAVFKQNCNSLALKLRNKFEIKDGGRKQKKRDLWLQSWLIVIAKLIWSGIWAPRKRVGNLSRSWVWVGKGGNWSLGRFRYFSPHKKIPVYLIYLDIFDDWRVSIFRFWFMDTGSWSL